MEQILWDLKALYQTRDVASAGSFVDKWFHGQRTCVAVGTCVGEICIGLDKIRDLLVNDLKYWYDLSIDSDSYMKEDAAGYCILHAKGTLSFPINENKKRYRRFVDICDATIGDRALTAVQKACSIEYTLSSLLSSRKRMRRICSKAVDIDMIMKDGKALFISYALEKGIGQADSFLGFYKKLDDDFGEEVSLMTLNGSVELTKCLAGMGYGNVSLNVLNEHIFFGIGTKQLPETLGERLDALFQSYKRETDYDSLFHLRLEIASVMKTYSFSDHPIAFVRFFGIAEGGEIKTLHVRFPNYLYIEDT